MPHTSIYADSACAICMYRCFLNAPIQLFLSDGRTADALAEHVVDCHDDDCFACSLGLLAAQRAQQHPQGHIDAVKTALLLSRRDQTSAGLTLPGLEYGRQHDAADALLSLHEHIFQEVSILLGA